MKKLILVCCAGLAGLAFSAIEGKLSASSYVQDGLAVQFDAIENAGAGVHDAAATVWKDLKGSAKITVNAGASWQARWFDTSTVDHNMSSLPALSPASISIEVPVNILSNGTRTAGTSCWPRLFRANERFDAHFSNSGTEPLFYVNQISSPRPAWGSFRNGTLQGVSDATNFRTYVDGVAKNNSGTTKVPTTAKNLDSEWNLNGCSGYLHGLYRGVRLYNRGLTDAELAKNALIDSFRFFSYTVTGMETNTALAWSTAGWELPWGRSSAFPNTLTNDFAQIVHARVTVAATDAVALKGLSLEDGAWLELDEGAKAVVKVLYVGGQPVGRGIYTGTGTFGTQVDWLEGSGALYVAGGLNRRIPEGFATAASDGWYEFGLLAADGGAVGYGSGYSTSSTSYHWIKGERPVWDSYVFPAGAKLRLKGYILLDTVPADLFSAYDMSQLQYVELTSGTAFEDGTTLVIPSGAKARFQATTWKESNGAWWMTSASGATTTFTGAIENNGTLQIYGDGQHVAKQTFTGRLTGTGTVYLTNYSNEGRFCGAWDFTGSLSGFQNANAVWIDTKTVGGRISSATFSNCSGQHSTNAAYCANGVMFGVDGQNVKADHELSILKLTGNARSIVDPKGKRWRGGGEIIVWGSNIVHVGTLSSGLHVVSRRQDQHCTNNFYDGLNGAGPGFLVVDTLSSGNIYGSTNIGVTVGQVAGASVFDYTYESGNTNLMTLAITNGCNAGASVKATDLAMLPARVSGFTGSVTLTDTAAKSYTIPMDFTQGTNTLYNTVGCIGSGTLVAAPTTGSIDATFPKDGRAVVGEYALARFSAGGALLKDWTVTLNGAAVESTSVGNGLVAQVKKDDTGLWLKVGKGGIVVLIR